MAEKEGEREQVVPVGEIAPPPTGARKPIESRVIRGTKRECNLFWWALIRESLSIAPDIPIFERKNWLIHLHYVRKDFETCKVGESYCRYPLTDFPP